MNLFKLLFFPIIHGNIVTSSEANCAMECTAVVPYSSLNLFPGFRENERIIVVGGESYRLKQQWENNGVSGVLWGSAVVLAEYIYNNPKIVRNKRVLELGAGLGLPSMVASKCGAKEVLATDQKLAVELLKENIVYNIPNAKNVHVSVVDWNDSNLDGTYDVILGADLVYNQELFEPLRLLLTKCVDASGVIVFAGRIRYRKDELFYESLSVTGFNVKETLYDREADIHIYHIWKK